VTKTLSEDGQRVIPRLNAEHVRGCRSSLGSLQCAGALEDPHERLQMRHLVPGYTYRAGYLRPPAAET
jgi:hypothetical protein